MIVNSKQQQQKHNLQEKLVKLHMKITPNGVAVKKIRATEDTGNTAKQQEAQTSYMMQTCTRMRCNAGRHDMQGMAKRIKCIDIMVWKWQALQKGYTFATGFRT